MTAKKDTIADRVLYALELEAKMSHAEKRSDVRKSFNEWMQIMEDERVQSEYRRRTGDIDPQVVQEELKMLAA